ncbi:IQ [Musa troglodytarum]|uniref:IQ n=1 Tax=Musa troglodytarum TaxID=320322 RepID=A0A9E7KHU3_9LILI|nr:IQ [Musa troglodytarum]URE19042.1 IQ [Musa troglodytarum]
MGKKGSWFSAIKRAFTSSSKDKFVDSKIPTQGLEKKSTREKKRWGFRKSKHGEFSSFIPLYREPSSIEKILEDAESEQHQRLHLVPPKIIQQSKSPALKPAVIPNYVRISATRIQAAYRGYKARQSYRALRGLMRLQRVMRGQNVKHQTMNTMRCMQMLVRVQSQIHSRRLQMVDSRSLQLHHTPGMSEKETESNFGQWSVAHQTEAGGYGEWDDSLLTKDEEEARMRRKVEAVIKRERALAYAYSHQLLKVTPRSAEAMLTGLRSGSAPWWWTWLERQLPFDQAYAAPPVETPRVQTPSFLAPGLPRATPAPAPQRPRRHRLRRKHEDADDASLTSCPPFAVPNYMAPTASAKAKVKSHHANQEPKKKRFSFSLGQSIGSLFGGKETMGGGGCGAGSGCGGSQRTGTRGRHRTTESVGGMSIDSIVSLPAGAVARRRSFA